MSSEQVDSKLQYEVDVAKDMEAELSGPQTIDESEIHDEGFDLFKKGGMNDSVTPEESLKVARKIDWHVLPILCILYGINYVDKAALGWAVLFTFKEDLGLVGDDYSWVSAIFYFGYLGGQYPAAYILQKFPVGKVIACTAFAWGIIMLGHMGCTNYAGILVCRFLLGVAEAPLSGGSILFSSQFWDRKEQVTRIQIYGSMQGIFYVIFSFVSWGLGHVTSGPLSEWQLIYLVLGLCSCLISIFWFVFIPDTPAKARFLNEEEKIIAVKRVSKNMMGTQTHEWRWNQVIECAFDPKVYLICAFLIFTMIPNGGLTNFGTQVLAGIVHSRLESILVSIGSSFFSSGQLLIYSIFATKFNNLRTIGMTAPLLLAIAGLSAVYATESHGAKWGRVFAYWMINSYAVTWPFTLTTYGSSFGGHTKRATLSSVFLIFFAVGNIIGPFCFKSNDAPKYTSALATNLGCFCAAFVVGVILRLYFMWENKRRDKKYGVVDMKGVSDEEVLEGILNGMKDKTDLENKQFRYLL